MRTARVLLLALACGPGLVAGAARADGVPNGMASVTADFSVVNLKEFPGQLFVTYPSDCSYRTHKARGVDDPQESENSWPDYEVIDEGPHGPSGICQESIIYVLERGAWTIGERERTPEEGVVAYFPAPILELQAMTATQRYAFFTGGDPRVRSTGRQVQPQRWVVDERERIRHVHDVLRIHRVGDQLKLRCDSVIYTYSDETTEEVACVSDARPQPTGIGEPTRAQLPSQPLSLVSSIPRWPFIAAAAGVFVIMALLGLRRRRA